MKSSPSSGVSRRRFLLHTVQGAAVAASAPGVISSAAQEQGKPIAPSEKITMGMIGTGPRGRGVLQCFLKESDVQVVAVCDTQRDRREATKADVDEAYGDHGCETVRDFRDLLARPDIDAVLIATGDRWHTLASITAAKAGKDIYCEKPFSMTIAESIALADTMRRYGRIYQAGTQRRTIPNFIFAVELARSGKLGKLRSLHAHTLNPATTQAWLPEQPLPEPDVVDWDMWLGPAPWRPYNSEYTRGNWRDHYDFHSGGIVEWGSHTVDQCQWANGADATTPVEFEPTADGAVARYANGVELVMRGPGSGWLGLGTCAVRYEGDEGWIETGDSGQFVVSPASLRANLRIEEMAGTDPKYHVREFVRAVRTRSQPSANASVAAQSHIACHAATIAWRLGRKLKFDPASNTFADDDQANRLRARAIRDPWQI
jgi:predicted dehydrogenase